MTSTGWTSANQGRRQTGARIATTVGAGAALGSILLCAVAFTAGWAGLNAQVAQGREIAIGVCAACHIVADRQDIQAILIQPILLQPTPSLPQIANAPDTSSASLHRFLKTAHWDKSSVPVAMPPQDLTDDDADAIVAYILSLRGHR